MKSIESIKANFLKEIIKTSNSQKLVKELCRAFIDSLKAYKKDDNTGLSIATIRREISFARSEMKDAAKTTKAKKIVDWATTGGENGFGFLTLNYEDEIKPHSEQKARNLSMQKNTMLDAAHIGTQDVLALLESNKANEIALGIGLAIGRRTAEILVSGKFEDAKGGFLRFTGQLKSGKKEAFLIPIAFNIPAPKIIAAVKALRAATMYATVDAANNYSASLNRAARAYLGTDFTFHDARKIYAAWCVKHLLEVNTVIKTVYGKEIEHEGDYVSAILGHESQTAKEYYTNVRL